MSLRNCQSCEREDTCVPAVKFCSECQEALCNECDRFHTKSKATANHRTVDIANVKDLSKITNLYCEKHHDLILDFVCIDHDVICCKQCMTETHRTCPKLLPLDDATRNIRSSALLHDTVKDLDAVVDAFQSIEAVIEEEISSIAHQKKSVGQKIDMSKDHLHALIDKLAKCEHDNLDRICKEHMEVLEKQKADCRRNKLSFEGNRDDLKGLMEHGSNNQLYCLAHQLSLSIVKGESLAIEQVGGVNKLELDFVGRQELSLCSSLGEIRINTTPITIPMSKFRKAQTVKIVQKNKDVEKKFISNRHIYTLCNFK